MIKNSEGKASQKIAAHERFLNIKRECGRLDQRKTKNITG